MSHDDLTYEDLLRIVELIKSSEQFSEFRLKVGDIEVELRRRNGAVGAPAMAHAVAVPPAPPAAVTTSAPAAPPPSAAPSTLHTPARPMPELPRDAIVIRSPMVGTFYRAPQPGARPFVAAGDSVDADTIVCIIEVMKLMNSIPAGAKGTVTHVLVDDAAPVEADQALIVLQPHRAA